MVPSGFSPVAWTPRRLVRRARRRRGHVDGNSGLTAGVVLRLPGGSRLDVDLARDARPRSFESETAGPNPVASA